MANGINTLTDLLTDDDRNITGVVISDKQGLCIKTTGKAKEECSGIITAMVDLTKKLEPNKPAPAIILESDTKICVIQSGRNMNAAVFKNVYH